MADDERKLSVAEVRKTIASSMASAFGFVIALVWSNVVLGGLARGGIQLSPASGGDWGGWAVFLVTAIVLTVAMILFIVVISRWGSRGIRNAASKAEK